MIVPYWPEDEEVQNEYKQILADNLRHFHVGQTGTSCVFVDHEKETIAGIVHINNYHPTYGLADLSGIFYDKRAFIRSNLITFYEWIFEDLGVTRLNMATTSDNLKAQKINTMLGGSLDAILPMWWGDEPMHLYSLLAPDALRILERLRRHAKKTDDLGA